MTGAFGGGSRGGGSGTTVRNDPHAPDGTPLIAGRILTLGQAQFLRVDNGTAPMNIDGRAVGAVVNVWNGTGVDDTGADWAVSGAGSETPGSRYSGTNGWDTGVAAARDDTVFNNGSMIDIGGTYTELKFWMQPKAYPNGSKFRITWLDGSNNVVGSTVRVANYTTDMDLDVWQQVSIPISDFNLDGNVQKLRFRYVSVAGQQYWLDDIGLVSSGGGGPFRFAVEAPDADTRYHVSMAVLVLSGASSGWNSTTFANISALEKGLILRQRRKSDAEIIWRFNSKDNVDLFGRFHPQDDITFLDGTLLVGFMVKPGKASVVITNDEVLEFVVRDDLSGLSVARAYVHYGLEIKL